MLKYKTLEHRFVKRVPEILELGVLYVSVEFATVVHSCCCGCGTEVVTPLSPTGWQVIFDGETISLWPSIGSWQIRCRSHYIIDRGRVVEANSWEQAQSVLENRREKTSSLKSWGEPSPRFEQPAIRENPKTPKAARNLGRRSGGPWQRIKRWWDRFNE